jgi:hypothetical protein
MNGEAIGSQSPCAPRVRYEAGRSGDGHSSSEVAIAEEMCGEVSEPVSSQSDLLGEGGEVFEIRRGQQR